MKKEIKELQHEEQKSCKDEKRGVFKVNLAILLAVLAMFGGIILLTGALGSFFGKAAETAALLVIAAVLVILLIRSKRS